MLERYECNYCRLDGATIRTVENIVGTFDEQGNLVQFKGYVFDDTEHKRAEDALRESKERYHRLFEDDLTGDFIASPDGQILVCNPAFVKIFGFSSREEAIGSNIAELYLHPEEYAVFFKHLSEQKVLERYECNYCRLDGATIRTVENIVGTFDEQGNLVQFKGYVFDDTERKRAEEALREAKDNLEIRVNERTDELEQANARLQIRDS